MKQFRELLIIIILILVAVWLVDLGVLDGIAAGLVQEPHTVVIQPIQGEPAPYPTTAPEPIATLPALPAYGPYTLDQHGVCFSVYHQDRLDELPEPQQSLCRGYVEVGQ